MLAWTIYSSFLGMAVLTALPRERIGLTRFVALATALTGLGLALAGWAQSSGELQQIVDAAWIPSLGIRYHLAADGISITLVVLTGIAATAGVLFSWNITHRVKEFFVFYFALIGGVYGVFLSFDLFLLFVFYEIAIIPKYFLIAIWGSTRREYGAMKLALYSFVGSAMVLVGLLAAYVVSGGHSTGLLELSRHPYTQSFQYWAFPLVFVGFGILAGLWPLHTWAPTGHVAAPTAASMLLAGVVMKLGAYGCLRVALALFPQGLNAWGFTVLGLASWRDAFALLAVLGIVFGAMIALVQKDFKFVIGYSSVSHMGFVLLGLLTLNATGLSGAVLQMFSHGIIAGLLFAVVGRMVYDRTHTREFDLLGPMALGKTLPFAAVTFVIASVASMGMPGFSGFVAELQVLIGAWQNYPGLTVTTGCGIVLGVAYALRAMQRAFFAEGSVGGNLKAQGSPKSEMPTGADTHGFENISVPEVIGAVMLVGCSLLVGLYPRVLLDLIGPGLAGPLFDGLRKAGAF